MEIYHTTTGLSASFVIGCPGADPVGQSELQGLCQVPRLDEPGPCEIRDGPGDSEHPRNGSDTQVKLTDRLPEDLAATRACRIGESAQVSAVQLGVQHPLARQLMFPDSADALANGGCRLTGFGGFLEG